MSVTASSRRAGIDLELVAALYFVGGVRVTFSTGIAAGGPLAYWCVSYSSTHDSVLKQFQDELYRDLCVHLHHCSRHCRGLLRSPNSRFNLPLGCGGWRASVRALVRIHRRLVEYDRLDDVLCQYVSSLCSLDRADRCRQHSVHCQLYAIC